MVEGVFAWLCVFFAWLKDDPMWAIAAAMFALSIHLDRIAKRGDDDA